MSSYPDYFSQALQKASESNVKEGRRMDQVYASDASVEIMIDGEAQIHGTCLRKQYYRINHENRSDPEEGIGNLKAVFGGMIHDWVERTYGQAGMLVRSEMPLWDEKTRMSGRIDCLIQPDPDSLERIGIEVKTVGGYYGLKGTINSTRDTPIYPRLYDLAQTVVYASILAKQGIQKWEILYVDRESGVHRSQHILYEDDNTIWVGGEPAAITPQKVYDRWERLWAAVETKSIPKRDYDIQYSKEKLEGMAARGKLSKVDTAKVQAGKMVDKGDNNCRWCEWRTKCWEEDV